MLRGGPGGGLQAPGWAPAALFGSEFFLSGSPGIRFPGGECHLRAHPAPSACSCRAGGGPQRLSHPTACRGACPKREPESNAGMLPRGSRGLFSPAPASLGIYFHLGCFNAKVREGNWKQIWVERGSCRVMPGFCFLAPRCSWAHASSVMNADTGRAGGAGAGGASPHGGTSPHSGAAQQQGAGGGSRILTAAVAAAPPGKGNLLEMKAKMSHTVSTSRGSFAERRALSPGCWEPSSAGLISQLPHPTLGLREEEEEEEARHSGSTGLSPPSSWLGRSGAQSQSIPGELLCSSQEAPWGL